VDKRFACYFQEQDEAEIEIDFISLKQIDAERQTDKYADVKKKRIGDQFPWDQARTQAAAGFLNCYA
jgi:hypothetical protein